MSEVKTKRSIKSFFAIKKVRVIAVVSLIAVAVTVGAIFALPAVMGGKVVDVVQVSMVSGSWWGEEQGCYGFVEEGGSYNVYLTDNLLPSETFVVPGQRVEAGDALFEYDMTGLELSGESASISYKMAQNELKKAQELLEEYKGYTVYQPPKPVIIAGIDELSAIDSGADKDLRTGSGTKADPYVYICDLDTKVTAEFMREFLQLVEAAPADPDDPENNPPEQGEGAEGTEEEPQPIPPEGEGEEDPSDEVPEPIVIREARYAVLKVYHSVGSEYSSVVVDTISVDGLENADVIGTIADAFSLSDVLQITNMGEIALLEGSPIEKLAHKLAVSAIPEPEPIPDNQRATQQEIDELIAAQQKTVRDLDLGVKQKKIDMEKAIAEIGDKTVLAEFGGTVQSVADVDSMELGAPYIVISSDTGYRVVGTVSEMNLELVHVGDTLRVYSWMTGSEMTAKVTEIDTMPQRWGNSMAMENPNSSYYQFYATLDTDEVFDRWSDVEIYFEAPSSEGEESSAMYLPLPYVREAEDGTHYVLKLDENEKTIIQPVQVGKTIYGSMIEVKSGLSMEDYIAFPYGKDAVEGASPNYDGEIYY